MRVGFQSGKGPADAGEVTGANFSRWKGLDYLRGDPRGVGVPASVRQTVLWDAHKRAVTTWGGLAPATKATWSTMAANYFGSLPADTSDDPLAIVPRLPRSLDGTRMRQACVGWNAGWLELVDPALVSPLGLAAFQDHGLSITAVFVAGVGWKLGWAVRLPFVLLATDRIVFWVESSWFPATQLFPTFGGTDAQPAVVSSLTRVGQRWDLRTPGWYVWQAYIGTALPGGLVTTPLRHDSANIVRASA